MESQTRTFSLGALLTLSTGIKLDNQSFHEMHQMLEFMVGQAIWIGVGFIIASDQCLPILIEQHPFLNDIPEALFLNKSDAEIQAKLSELRNQYGDVFAVSR